jgi:AbrB family looped-hinge helix DNA binding protein
MAVVKTYAKGQIIIPKELRDALGITPGKRLSLKLVDDHMEVRPLPDDPIEHLTGIFKGLIRLFNGSIQDIVVWT